MGTAFWGAYAASKCAADGLAHVLADEVGESTPIRVNTVNPGPTRTRMRRQAFPGEDPASLKSPDQVLSPFLYLLGPDSAGINGRRFDAQ